MNFLFNSKNCGSSSKSRKNTKRSGNKKKNQTQRKKGCGTLSKLRRQQTSIRKRNSLRRRSNIKKRRQKGGQTTSVATPCVREPSNSDIFQSSFAEALKPIYNSVNNYGFINGSNYGQL